ncbi:MAG TPA: hypothetical protein VG165_08740 [Solirubrobacteraceae bacterium]|nr:hypothetical protein [Solirubrobacteraceae bacterium]
MTDFLDRLEHQLVDAAASPAGPVQPVRRPTRRIRLPLVAVGALLASATIALAATGLLTGSVVTPAGPLTPAAGEGIPAPGGTRLLSLRVADPAGGPPWGMRIVRTTRGLVCLQIGRVQNGELGELGIDGAYHDDGRFHPLPAAVLPTDPRSGVATGSSCHLAGQTFSGSLDGIDRNAASSSGTPSDDRREISYGLLGAHALSVTYDTPAGEHTMRVQSATGAYLVVEAATTPQPTENMGASIGVDRLDARRPGPTGALSAITYRFGALICTDSPSAPAADACPRPSVPAALHPAPLRDLDQPVRARLEIRRGLIYGAEIRFTAPYAVTSARAEYEIAMPIHGTGDVVSSSIDRDVARRATVVVHVPYVFANTRGARSQLIEVIYTRVSRSSAPSPVQQVMIGTVTLHEPPGTAPAPPGVGPPPSP